MVITALYAALLGLIHTALTMYVVFGRWRYRVSLGDGDEKDMRRRIRAHGNFIETAPISLILLYLAERYVFIGQSSWVHAFGVMIVLGRLLHILGITRRRSVNKLRQTGMVLSMSAITLLSMWLLYQASVELL